MDKAHFKIFKRKSRLAEILKLFGFLMLGMFFAERAVFRNGKPVGVVTLILIAVVIPVLAFGTFESYFSPC